MADGSQHKILTAVEMLRSERLKQKLDLADIAKETCIRSQFLEAIEAGDTDALPGQAFVVGFVRSYARALNLDEDSVVSAYRDEHKQDGASQITGTNSVRKSEAVIKAAASAAALEQPRRGVPKWLAPFLGLVGAVLSWSWFNADGHPAGLIEQQQIAEVTRLAAIQAEYSLNQDVDATDKTRLATTSEEDWQFFAGIVEARLAAANADTAPDSAKLAAGSILIPSVSAGTNSVLAVAVTLIAEEDTWIQLLHADGTEAWSGLLSAGEQYRTDLSGALSLTTSNAGGLYLDVGGEQLGPLGERGAIISGVALDKNIATASAFQNS